MSFRLTKLNEEEIKNLITMSNKCRGDILKMTTMSASGHPGGSMSTIDFLTALYKLADLDSQNPRKDSRDKIVVSNGHISPAVYSVLAANNYFDIDDAISQFRLAGSIFEGHIETTVPGVEWGTGNLGQGLSAACGFALAMRYKGEDNQVFCIMGDGEQQKGQLSEARRFAVKHNLNNITAFVDYNKLQISGAIDKVMFQDIKANYLSDGWEVIELDAHDFNQIQDALIQAVKSEKPVALLGHSIMGKGVSFMENKEKYHGSTLSETQLGLALKELKLETNFDKYKKLRANFKPQQHENIQSPNFNIDTGNPIVYKDKLDNRSAWGNAIGDIAKINKDKNPLLTVFDCDLQGSVKTNEFEKYLPDNFIQAGIMEHNAATVSGALSYAGVQSFFADFGVFGVDETYNQHRLNDINNSNLKLITTHNGLNVGEDGKTHQCIDYVGTFRNLFHFDVVVPADPNQTDRVIRHIADKAGNVLVVMGRSKQEIIRDEAGKIFFDENYKFEFGKADKLRNGNKVEIISMGCMTEKAIEICDMLKEKNIDAQVWNVATPNNIDTKMI
ncbi:MAG: transketolase, partial [Candidatus Cloacimonadota bacterium]|nr:transketolase [Candidatus Cloacimonadota bacterium]